MGEKKVTFEFSELEDGDSYIDFNFDINIDLCKFTTFFTCELEELKEFADAILNEGSSSILHGSGSGSSYCIMNITSDGTRITIDCDPRHGCKTVFTFDKILLQDFAHEALKKIGQK